MSRVLRFILATMFLFAVLYLVGVAHAQLPLATGGKWVLTVSMHDARDYDTVTLLANGQVLVAGALMTMETLSIQRSCISQDG